jgi:hypothetical protein
MINSQFGVSLKGVAEAFSSILLFPAGVGVPANSL